MKTSTQLISLSIAFFLKDKNLTKVFAFANGQIFTDENRARLYKSERDKKMEYNVILRSQAITSDDVVVGKVETTKDDVEERNNKIKELEALELPTKDYQLAKSLVNYFNIETEDMKSGTLNDALISYKQNISK